MTTTTDTPDPFAGIRDSVPTRYAPGETPTPYDFPRDPNAWVPVIYFPAGEVVKGEGKIWLVEPYPAGRADGTDGLDPVDSAGVAVVRGGARPHPRGEDPLGDWIIPEKSLVRDTAYDVYVTNQRDLMAAWCEAYAIAVALNNGLVKRLGLHPEDIEVLLATERGALIGDSRFAGTINELRWFPIGDQIGSKRRIGARQAKRLRSSRLIEAAASAERRPSRPELSTSGLPWTETTYRLTRAATTMLAEIRGQYDGPTRCRVCGCTDERGCPDGSCSWADADLCSRCVGDDRDGPGFLAQLGSALRRDTPAFK